AVTDPHILRQRQRLAKDRRDVLAVESDAVHRLSELSSRPFAHRPNVHRAPVANGGCARQPPHPPAHVQGKSTRRVDNISQCTRGPLGPRSIAALGAPYSRAHAKAIRREARANRGSRRVGLFPVPIWCRAPLLRQRRIVVHRGAPCESPNRPQVHTPRPTSHRVPTNLFRRSRVPSCHSFHTPPTAVADY